MTLQKPQTRRALAPQLTRFLLVSLVLTLTLAGPLAAANDQVIRETYSRYQASYRAYQEALNAGRDTAEVQARAQDVRAALAAYNNALGISAAPAGTQQSAVDSSAGSADQAQTDATVEAPANAGTAVAKAKSAEERAYDLLLKDLYTPSRKNRGTELRAKLQQFLATARNPYFVMQATFELASLESDLGRPEVGKKILEDYAGTAPTKEAARLAKARIKIIDQETLIRNHRQMFDQRQQRTATAWVKYRDTSWLALPAKLVRLGSFLTSNVGRRMAGRELDKLLDGYDEAVRQSMPKGTLDAFTNSRLLPCNEVSLLVNGRSSFARRFALARQARDRILVQTLLYYNDATGNELADILIEKAQAGVEVKIIVDDAFGFSRKKSVFRRLQNGGVKVLFNNPLLARPWKANFRSHQKMFIIDDEVAIVGGMNIAQEYAQGEIQEWGWRDTDIEARGPLVAEVVELFERNWESLTLAKLFETGDPPQRNVQDKTEKTPILPQREHLIRGPLPVYFAEPPTFQDVRVRFLTTFPAESEDDDILDLFIAYLGAARQEVIFQSAYFIPRPSLTKAIVEACRRGVSVRIITNSVESNNHPNAGYAGRANYETVLRAGAEIYEWRGAQTLHSKVSLFDDFAMTVGAYNMNSRSHSCDSEDVIAIEDRRMVTLFRTVLARDLQRCRRITLAEVQTWQQDFLQNMKMKFFSLFQGIF